MITFKTLFFFYRELKKTETKETATLRSKSISTLKNVRHDDIQNYHILKNNMVSGWSEDKKYDK